MVLHRERPIQSRKAKELAQHLFQQRPDFGWTTRDTRHEIRASQRQQTYLRRAVGVRDRQSITHAAALGAISTSSVRLLLSHPILAKAARTLLVRNGREQCALIQADGEIDPRFIEEVARLLEKERVTGLDVRFALHTDIVHARDVARIVQAAIDHGIVSLEEAVFALSDPTIFHDLACALGLRAVLDRKST